MVLLAENHGEMFVYMYVGKRSLAEMRQFYFKAREDVFKDPHGGITFDSDAFEHMIVDAFGEMKMNDVQHPK